MKDDGGLPVMHGDAIEFSFGIPPRRVEARVVRFGKTLYAVSEWPINPPLCPLASLRQYVGSWWKKEEA